MASHQICPSVNYRRRERAHHLLPHASSISLYRCDRRRKTGQVHFRSTMRPLKRWNWYHHLTRIRRRFYWRVLTTLHCKFLLSPTHHSHPGWLFRCHGKLNEWALVAEVSVFFGLGVGFRSRFAIDLGQSRCMVWPPASNLAHISGHACWRRCSTRPSFNII